MSTDGSDTSRTSVRTYVPAYQKTEWQRHAEELDMSQSEFVRTMVQAGRSVIERDKEVPSGTSSGASTEDTREPGGGGSSGDEPLGSQVQEALDREEHLGWDELVAELTGNFEDRLETTLDRLQRENVVGYSGRHDGYVLLSDDGE
jgi:hypothetical protein